MITLFFEDNNNLASGGERGVHLPHEGNTGSVRPLSLGGTISPLLSTTEMPTGLFFFTDGEVDPGAVVTAFHTRNEGEKNLEFWAWTVTTSRELFGTCLASQV